MAKKYKMYMVNVELVHVLKLFENIEDIKIGHDGEVAINFSWPVARPSLFPN